MATSLDDLPISPQTDTNNIKLETTENVIINNSIQNLQTQRENDEKVSINKSTSANTANDINQFVTGIQKAASSGALNLPSRDIPQEQVHITQDNSIQPNFIPQNGTGDYIGAGQSSEEIIKRNAQKTEKTKTIDYLYNDYQVPILIAVLYFIFQLPIIKKTISKILPPLFFKDGNPNLMGYTFNSIAFATLYYIFNKIILYLSI